MKQYKIAPSSFAFLLDECRLCFHRHHVAGIARPRAPMPGVFSAIDKAMKAGIGVEEMRRLGVPVTAPIAGSSVASAPVDYPELGVSLVVAGRLDSRWLLEDGFQAIVDNKTSSPSAANVVKYGRQLHSYEFCVRRPAKGDPCEVATLGLVTFDGYQGSWQTAKTELYGRILAPLAFCPIRLDRAGFEASLDAIAALLAGPPPEPDRDCAYCQYLAAGRAA